MRFTKRTFKPGAYCVLVLVLAVLPFFILTGCTRTVTKIEREYVNVPTPVATGCIATTGRPDVPTPISRDVKPEDWDALAPGSKAEAVRAQAGKRMNYEDGDRAATSGCK